MFCTNCGFNLQYTTGSRCPSCGRELAKSVAPKTPKKAVVPKPILVVERTEEETFYYGNRFTIDGLKAYCEKYPNGKFVPQAKANISNLESKKAASIKKTIKVLKIIATVILVPFIFCLGTACGAKYYWVGKLIKWCEEE